MAATYFDSHAHLTSEMLYPEIDALLDRASKAAVGNIANICTDIDTLEKGLELVKRFPWIHNVAATTPHDIEAEGELFFPIVTAAAKRGDLVAIGESGLDYYYYPHSAALQQHYLRRYLQLALECQLPIVIHCREAFADLFKTIDDAYMQAGKHAPGVLHCFTGSVHEAHEIAARGWFLSLSGIVTFKKSTVLQQVAKEIPLERLLIETDAPFLAPQSKRGKKNEPSYIAETARCIADLKGISVERVAAVTNENAFSLFNLKN